MTTKSFIKTIGEKGLLADYNTSGKKLQTELTAGNNITIDGNTISSDQIFVATYGTTTYQEIKDAYDAGKICIVKKGDTFAQIYAVTLSNIRFIMHNPVTKTALSYNVYTDNTWTDDGYTAQTKLTFDTTPTAGSNNPVTSDGIKTAIDAKADANKVVAIADAMVTRIGQSGSGWYKLAERTVSSSNDNVNYCFDVYAATASTKFAGLLDVAIRTGSSAGDSIRIPLKKFYSDEWLSDYQFKIAIRGLTDSATIELWASCLRNFGGIAISERNTSTFTANNEKGGWTYTSYVKNGGSDAPVTDATTNVQVADVDVVYRQLAIDSPTNDNLVAMDEKGLVKDSGIRITSSDIANWNRKQNSLTFDTAPKAGSTNPVTSDGIKTALDSRVPAPTSTTGTQVLKCINGVIQWVTE